MNASAPEGVDCLYKILDDQMRIDNRMLLGPAVMSGSVYHAAVDLEPILGWRPEGDCRP
jgi:hypothetical protein